MKNRLTIAIQKKGRLFDQSTDLIKKSGINFSTKGDNLLAKSNNLPIDILFVRSDDAIFPYVGLIVDRLQFGFTYDVAVSNLKTSSYTPRTFELSVIYHVANKNLKERKLIRCSRW